MDFKNFIEQTEPEVLEKLAAEAQDELVRKVIDAMFPLFEKTANYTAHLILEKLAEEVQQEEAPAEEVPAEQEQEGGEEAPVKLDATPATGNKTNESMNPSATPGGLKAQDVKDAIDEAMQVGQSDKILPFVEAVMKQYPETANEVIKMVKVALHDGIMKQLIDEESAIAITDKLNAMVGVQA